MTYTWEILSLETKDVTNTSNESLSGAVLNIVFRRRSTADDGSSYQVTGSCRISADSVSSADFVSFDNLTEEMVVGWLENALGATLIAEYDASLQDRHNIQDTVSRDVPWS